MLREQKTGFREERGCSDQIFVLRKVIEQWGEWRKSIIFESIDFREAFEYLHRESMWKVLEI